MSFENRRQLIYAEISQIHESGEVAPSNTWISKFSVTKPNGKRYVYYRLMESDRSRPGKAKMLRYLGSKKSPNYKRFVAAIERRNRLQKLERELKRLCELEKKVSGDNQKDVVSQTPPLTNFKKAAPLQHFQQQVEYIMAKFEELVRLFEKEQQERKRLSEKLEALANVV